jgi:4a-hydroxytetrahydrobiopterin dehydratase
MAEPLSERANDAANDLAGKKCVPCRAGTPALHGPELERLAAQLPDWQVVQEHHLEKSFRFPDFVSALAFVNRVGAVAEEEGHHPDLMLSWGRVQMTTYTHSIKGLSESDFILAAKADRLFQQSAT